MEEINGRYKIRIPCPDGINGCAVCHYAWLDIDAYNQIHDRYYDTYGRKPSDSVIAQIYPQLYKDIHTLAKEWGWNDTEVRERVSEWMEEKVVVFYD